MKIDAPELENEDSLPSAKAECLCDTCGQKVRKLNRHSMDKAKVDILLRIAHMNANGNHWVKIQQDERLIKDDEPTIQCDAVHATRLFWFGLLDRKSKREGLYRINDYAVAFLRGLATVPVAIYCRQGNVEYQSKARVTIDGVKDVILDKNFWDTYASHSQLAAA